MIQTTTFTRVRTEVYICQGNTPAAVIEDYSAYEGSKASDTSKTWTVRALTSYFQPALQDIPASFYIVAEASYPEVNSDGTQVPEIIAP